MSTRMDIRAGRFHDAVHDATSPSDVRYDIGRVSANHIHGIATEAREREKGLR